MTRSAAGRRAGPAGDRGRRIRGRRAAARNPDRADPGQPGAAAQALRRAGAGRAGGLDPRARRAAAGHRPAGRAAAMSWSPASAGGEPLRSPARRDPRARRRRARRGRLAELALIENIVREDLSPIEQARTFSVLLDDLRMTGTVLAKRIGRSREDIANTMRLLALPDQAVEMIDRGRSPRVTGRRCSPIRPPPPTRARAPGGGAWVVGPRPRGRDRPGSEAGCLAADPRPGPVRRGHPARGCGHPRDRMRRDRQASSPRLPDPPRPACCRQARACPRRRHRSPVMRGVAPRSTWNRSRVRSRAGSRARCRTSHGPRPRQHWVFWASVIPTTRPPRGRSGSRDHALPLPGQAGAGAMWFWPALGVRGLQEMGAEGVEL